MDTTDNHFEHILYEINMFLFTCLYHIPEDMTDRQMYANLIVDSRAIHLRNLGEFFREKKEGKNWHYTDYVNSSIHIIDKELFGKIKRYTSKASCHLADERLRKDFKSNTMDCVKEAFSQIVLSIDSFFLALDNDIKPEYADQWKNEEIQAYVKMIREKTLSHIIYKYQYIHYTTE